jgi:hypothetical protein
LNNVSVVSSSADISFHQSPGQTPFISPRSAAFLKEASQDASPSVATSSPPSRRPPPTPPAALFEDTSQYSGAFSGSQAAELSRDVDVSLQVRLCHVCGTGF